MMIITETFALHRYETRQRVTSQIAQGVQHEVVVGITCPRCGDNNPPLEHFGSQSCRCGLKMTVHGNALQCEVEDDGST